ncbi:hypothetical protein BSPWISOX_2390 [uncultured Gammaproteobacteria bacterium]|jgi:hypothetical protein|nr:hypothetical protein BSPWISOX_2390 [uncultured Gammaproteobacteria bacterium]
MNKIEKFIYLYYEELIDDCFGYWIGFWYGDESFTLEETKELFFLTLKKLLDDNKVVFFPPEPNSKIKIYKYCSNGEYYADSGEYEEELWDETSENIIAYIKDIFPKDITNENDMRLTDFWYDTCPEIGWVDQETGEIVAS